MKNPSYITPGLDDAGLNPFQFRVLLRVLRRAWKTGVCTESAHRMGKELGIKRHTVSRVTDELVEMRLVDAPEAVARHRRPIRPIYENINAVARGLRTISDIQSGEEPDPQTDRFSEKAEHNLGQKRPRLADRGKTHLGQKRPKLGQKRPRSGPETAIKNNKKNNKEERDRRAVVDSFFPVWNEEAEKHGFPKLNLWTNDRKKKLQDRLKKSPHWVDKVIPAVRMLGEWWKGNDWHDGPNFDWLLRTKTDRVLQVLEWKPTGKSKAGKTGSNGSAPYMVEGGMTC